MYNAEVNVEGVRSPVIAAGPPLADEAVVYVHGNPGSARDWPELGIEVASFARFVALDMPGFGKADKPETFDYTVPGYARHLGGALSALGVRRAHLVLHDFGGPWALAWAAAHPDAFASATLIGTGVLVGFRWHYMARIWRTPGLGELFMATASRRAFRLLLKRGNPRGLPASFIEQMFNDFDQGTRRAVLRLYRATNDPSGMARRLATALAPLRRPALVIWGKRDPYIPWPLAERQREVFPDAKVVIMEDSGHWPFVDNRQAVTEMVIQFLCSQVRAPAGSFRPVKGHLP